MFYLPMGIRHGRAADVPIYEACYILASYSVFRMALPDLDCSSNPKHDAKSRMSCDKFAMFVIIGILNCCLFLVDAWKYYVWPWLFRSQRPNWPQRWWAWILDFEAIWIAALISILDLVIALMMICAGSMLSLRLFGEGGSILSVVGIEIYYFGTFVLTRSISMLIPAFLPLFLQILLIILRNSVLAPIILLGVSAIFLNYYKYAVV